MNQTGSLEALFANRDRISGGACRLCGKTPEALVTIEVRERVGAKYGRRRSRSMTVCGPCAVGRWESLLEVFARA